MEIERYTRCDLLLSMIHLSVLGDLKMLKLEELFIKVDPTLLSWSMEQATTVIIV